MFAFLARDTLAATVLGLFATSWLLLGVALIIGRRESASHWGSTVSPSQPW